MRSREPFAPDRDLRENLAQILMADALETTAALLDRRWRRAVDLLLRETIRYRRAGLAEWERLRVARRRRSLQRIVRKALSDYHRIQVERRDSGPSGR